MVALFSSVKKPKMFLDQGIWMSLVLVTRLSNICMIKYTHLLLLYFEQCIIFILWMSFQMFGLMISEYVPNTFLTHIYENDFGNFHEVFKTHNLPKFVKPIAKVLCRTCELHMFANLTRCWVFFFFWCKKQLFLHISLLLKQFSNLNTLIKL